MPTLIFTYSPQAGVSNEEFERFLAEEDQPVTLAASSAVSSRIFRIVSEGAPYAYLEVLDVTDFDQWTKDGQREEVKPLMERWNAMGNMAEVKSYNGTEVFAGEHSKYAR